MSLMKPKRNKKVISFFFPENKNSLPQSLWCKVPLQISYTANKQQQQQGRQVWCSAK